MTRLNADSERLIQEAIGLARRAIDAMKQADAEERQADKRDTTAVYEDLYGDGDYNLDPRQIARNWHDAQERAEQATTKLDEMQTDARWSNDDLLEVLIRLEESVENKDLQRDLQYARCHAFSPSMEDEGYWDDLDRRLQRLIEFLEDLTKPDERAARVQLIAWARQHPDMKPWGKTNQQLRDFFFRVGTLTL